MKKTILVFVTGICVILGIILVCIGINSNEEQNLNVYSFSGKNGFLTLSNGVFVFTPEEQILYGGNLECNLLDDITSYSVIFCTTQNDEKRVLLDNSITDETGNTIDVSGICGKITGDFLKDKNIIENDFYFELETTNISGDTFNYRLDLDLIEITKGS